MTTLVSAMRARLEALRASNAPLQEWSGFIQDLRRAIDETEGHDDQLPLSELWQQARAATEVMRRATTREIPTGRSREDD